MTDEFSLKSLMEQSEGGCICEPHNVQTVYKDGKVSHLDLPLIAATHYAEIKAERDTLAARVAELEEALELANLALRGCNMDMKHVEKKVRAALQEKTDD